MDITDKDGYNAPRGLPAGFGHRLRVVCENLYMPDAADAACRPTRI